MVDRAGRVALIAESTAGQTTENQRRNFKGVAERPGFTVSHTYEDVAIGSTGGVTNAKALTSLWSMP